ncbi:GntR family transcriptional regulator [Streptomyces murinus]|uniref:GntR family transcriptional regulator n=1 Tax=Streptomyces murinus TaxID=33900 RepID=UPI0036E6130B
MTQYATPDLIDPRDDPAWRSTGAATRAVYSRWSPHLSGIASLRMALLHRDRACPSLFALLAGARRHQAYAEHPDGHITGLNYAPFAHYIRVSHALPADVHLNLTMTDVVDLLDGGHMVMASVSEELAPRPAGVPESPGGHVVLAIGHRAGRIHFRNPAGHTDHAREAVLPLDRFAAYFSGEGLSLDFPSSPRPYPYPLPAGHWSRETGSPQELVAKMRAHLADGRWDRDQVYTRSQLCDVFDVAADHVAPALAILREEGLVETRANTGTRPKIPGRSWAAPNGVPNYEHIERTVRSRIAAGVYPVGESLPFLDALALEFGVSRSVVGTGLRPLKTEGLLVRNPLKQLVVSALQPQHPPAADPKNSGTTSFTNSVPVVDIPGSQITTIPAESAILAREQQRVAAELINGMPIEWIAERLHISVSAVTAHLRAVRRKMDLSNSSSAVLVHALLTAREFARPAITQEVPNFDAFECKVIRAIAEHTLTKDIGNAIGVRARDVRAKKDAVITKADARNAHHLVGLAWAWKVLGDTAVDGPGTASTSSAAGPL